MGIKMKRKTEGLSDTLMGYLKTTEAKWYWISLLLSASAILSTFLIPTTAYPFVFVRYILGLIQITFLPGYAITRMLFPEIKNENKKNNQMNSILRLTLIIGISLAVNPIIGLFLHLTNLGISIVLISLVLGLSTIIFSTLAILNEFITGNI